MIHYNDIKDSILYSSNNIQVTLDNFISTLEVFLNDVELFENTVNKILHTNPKNKDIADEIMKLTSSQLIRLYINIIKNTL